MSMPPDEDEVLFKPPEIPKLRKCLGPCGKPFLSTHIGNRICEPCKKSETFRGANFLSIGEH